MFVVQVVVQLQQQVRRQRVRPDQPLPVRVRAVAQVAQREGSERRRPLARAPGGGDAAEARVGVRGVAQPDAAGDVAVAGQQVLGLDRVHRDDAAEGARAVEGGRPRPPQHLDPLEEVGFHEQRALPVALVVFLLAVQQLHDRRFRRGDPLAHAADVERLPEEAGRADAGHARHDVQHVADGGGSDRRQFLVVDHRHRLRHARGDARLARAQDDGVQCHSVGFLRRGSQRGQEGGTGKQHGAAGSHGHLLAPIATKGYRDSSWLRGAAAGSVLRWVENPIVSVKNLPRRFDAARKWSPGRTT